MNLNDLKNYVEEKLNEICKESYPNFYIKVYDEINFNYEPNDNEIVVMFKSLAGNINEKTAIYPVQLTIFSEKNALKTTKDIFNIFVKKYSNTTSNIGSTQLKQFYNTIVDINNFIEVNNGYRCMCYVSASYVLIENTCDLKEIYIDGEKINFLNYNIAYTATVSSANIASQKILRSKKQTASLQLQLTMYAENTNFLSKIRALRKEELNGSKAFNIKLVFFDNDVEENYTMMVVSATLDGSKTTTGSYSIVLSLC